VTINDRDSDLDTYFCIVVKVAVFNLRVFSEIDGSKQGLCSPRTRHLIVFVLRVYFSVVLLNII